MSFTLTISGSAINKAGLNANSSIIVNTTALNKWSDEAEGRIVAETRRDWVTEYSTLSTDIKNVLSDVCSSLIAKQIIQYDISGYTGRGEAALMLNVQDDTAREGLKILKDFKSNIIKSP